MARVEICYCAVCDTMLYQGDHLADHKKFECDGELDYIELAHVECGIKSNAENADHPWYGKYWEYDQLTPSQV